MADNALTCPVHLLWLEVRRSALIARKPREFPYPGMEFTRLPSQVSDNKAASSLKELNGPIIYLTAVKVKSSCSNCTYAAFAVKHCIWSHKRGSHERKPGLGAVCWS